MFGNLVIDVERMPTRERFVSRSRRRYFDTYEFIKIIREWKALGFEFYYAAVEAVHASPAMGVVSAFSFGHTAGLIIGALEAENIRVVPVEPSVWKVRLGVPKDKSLSVARANEILTGGEFKKDGVAEAAMIGFYKQQQLSEDRSDPLS